MSDTRTLLLGCGGVGGVLAAHLCQRGHALEIVTHNERIARAICERGIVVHERERVLRVTASARPDLPASGERYDCILLAMQPPQLEEAVRHALPLLAPRGAFVCFQNGLCELRVAALAGPERVIGAIVAWGASMHEPGVYERTSSGGFTLGTLGAVEPAVFAAVAGMLASVGPVATTANLLGARWSKLAINCAISSLGTIGGERLGTLLRYRFARRLGLEVMTEAVTVARACGIRLEKVAGTIDLDWVALDPEERFQSGSASLVAKHTLLLAVGARFRRLRSSMLAAIERGRPPAVDFLNGEVVSLGERHGVPTPLNRMIVEWVWDIARGKRRPSVALLRDLYEASAALRSRAVERAAPPPGPPPLN